LIYIYFGLTPAEKKKLSNKLGGSSEMNSEMKATHLNFNKCAQGRHNSWIEEFSMNKRGKR